MTDDEDYRYCPADLFPQLLGVRTQHVSDRFYQLRSRQEAAAYWDHPMLSRDLVALAEELLRMRRMAFAEGMATSTEVIDAENALSEVSLARLAAYYGYDVALANLLALCGMTDEFDDYMIYGKEP